MTVPMTVPVTLLFSTSDHRLSAVIRRLTRSRASHCLIGCEMAGLPVVLHCTEGGVQVTPRKRWFSKNTLVAEYEFRQDVSRGVRHAADLLGERYDYLSILGFLWVLFWGRLGAKVKNPLASKDALVCSEFVLHVDRYDDVPEWDALDYESTTPEDILRTCEDPRSTSFVPLV